MILLSHRTMDRSKVLGITVLPAIFPCLPRKDHCLQGNLLLSHREKFKQQVFKTFLLHSIHPFHFKLYFWHLSGVSHLTTSTVLSFLQCNSYKCLLHSILQMSLRFEPTIYLGNVSRLHFNLPR